jgi:hypothetical protein
LVEFLEKTASEKRIMSARRKILTYGLSSQKGMSQIFAAKLLSKRGFVMNERNSKCLFPHSSKESLKHWIVKAIIFKILLDRGMNVGSEIEVGNRIVDVFDSDNKIAYEIENDVSGFKRRRYLNFAANDVFVINLKKVPDDIELAKKYLQRIVV